MGFIIKWAMMETEFSLLCCFWTRNLSSQNKANAQVLVPDRAKYVQNAFKIDVQINRQKHVDIQDSALKG